MFFSLISAISVFHAVGLIYSVDEKPITCWNIDMELSQVSYTTEYLKYLDTELQYSKYV